MPQSLSDVYPHLIFSTKERRPFLRDKPQRSELHAYLGASPKPWAVRLSKSAELRTMCIWWPDSAVR